MKRLISLTLILVLLVTLVMSLSPCGVASADLASQFADPYEGMVYYSNNYVDRTECTAQEANAASFLANVLQQLGYEGLGGSMIQPFSFRQETYDTTDILSVLTGGKMVEYESCNVVAIKRSSISNAPMLVLAANYGNAYKLELYGSSLDDQCVYETSSSVAVLMNLAYKLRNTSNLPFDLAFVFLGADYYGYYGADAFYKSVDKPLIGYIQVDAIGGGDHINLYCDEVSTTHEKYLLGVAGKFGYDFHTQPFDAGYSSGGYELPYTHVGLNGSNALFVSKGVPSAYLFGYNWVGGWDSAESATAPNVLGTADDNLSNLIKNYGIDNVKTRLNTVVTYLTSVVTDSEMPQAFGKDIGKKWYWALNTEAARLGFKWSAVAIAVLAIVIVAVLLAKRSAKADQPDFSRPAPAAEGERGAEQDPYSTSDPYATSDPYSSSDFDGETPVERPDEDDPQPPTQDNPPTSSGDDDIFGEY